MTDVKKFHEFMQQMDWEGGYVEIIEHGFDSTGDGKLDGLMEELEAAYEAVQSRVVKLVSEYGEFGEEEDE